MQQKTAPTGETAAAPTNVSVQPSPRPRGRIARYFSARANSVYVMFAWGFGLRILGILLLHTYRIRTHDRLNHLHNFLFGYETGRIAASIANGLGFSNPFDGNTGPTAWVAPTYPYLTASVFKLFGTYTQSSAFVLLSINSLFSALTAIPVYLIAKRIYGDRVARWAGWTWALLPYAMYWAIKWVWETSISAFLLAVLFWLTLKLEDDRRFRTWLIWGALWGLMALTNPACLSFLLFAGIWVCWRRLRQGLRWFVPVLASALVFVAVITPWEIRNYEVFHKFIFVRGNFGVEFRLGNAANARGIWMWWIHPTQNQQELAKYKQMGEVAYVASRKQEAFHFVQQHPAQFAWLSAIRATYYWAGAPQDSKFKGHSELKNGAFLASSILTFWGLWLTVRRRKQAAFLFASLILVYPVVYYITFASARYRHPIEPIMIILLVYTFSETREAQASLQRRNHLNSLSS